MLTVPKSGTIQVLCIFLAVYVAPYLVMSRIGFRRADNITNADGFYFVDPTTPFRETVNSCFRVIFAPLTWIDNALGTGRPAGSDPIRSLSSSVRETHHLPTGTSDPRGACHASCLADVQAGVELSAVRERQF